MLVGKPTESSCHRHVSPTVEIGKEDVWDLGWGGCLKRRIASVSPYAVTSYVLRRLIPFSFLMV
jgi:hypothetical protein